ncbi:DNA polymerase III subunit delta' [Aphanothece hegewaldii]|nr:DNA polymerase III subunit delta' [Aphanothece hegewaldii]
MVTDLLHQIIGQPIAIQLLTAAINSQAIAPAYLFTGIAGIGKLTTAKLYAQMILSQNISNHPDVLMIEPTCQVKDELIPLSMIHQQQLILSNLPQIRVEQIRQINQFLVQSPLKANRKIVIIESAEYLNPAAANAFLKSLEEPYTATIILTCAVPDKLLSTLISRCHVIPFYPLGEHHINQLLTQLNNFNIPAHIRHLGQGSIGKTINIWNLLKQFPSELLNFQKKDRVTKIYETIQTLISFSLEQQLILADYWQYQAILAQDVHQIEKLEKVKSFLSKRGNPSLIWESFFFCFAGSL